MNFINIIKNSALAVIKNPAMMLLFILFAIGANLLMIILLRTPTRILAQILVLCLFGFICLFLAGWFEVIKKSCDSEKISETNFYSVFSLGISKNIIPVSIACLICFVGVLAAVTLAEIVAHKVFGNIDFLINGLNTLPQTDNALFEFYNSLTVEQKNVLDGWNACIMTSILLFNLLFLFYFPAVVDDKNSKFNIILRPFVAIWHNIKFFFKHFLGVIAIGVLICIFNAAMLILVGLTARYAIVSLIGMLAHIYLLVISIMLIFNYYEQKNNGNNGLDLIGQDEVSDSAGENN